MEAGRLDMNVVRLSPSVPGGASRQSMGMGDDTAVLDEVVEWACVESRTQGIQEGARLTVRRSLALEQLISTLPAEQAGTLAEPDWFSSSRQ